MLELFAYTGEVFVDAPHVLQPVDLAGMSTTALGASEAAVNTPEPNPEELPRGWWRSNPERTRYEGVVESLASLSEVLSKDTFDVCPSVFRARVRHPYRSE